MKAVSILMIAMLSSSGRTPAATAPNAATDCRLHRMASFDMVIEHNHIVLPVTINETSVQMVLDIKQSVTVLDKSAVAQLKLPTTPLNARVLYGSVPLDRTARVQSLVIGGVHYSRSDFAVSPTDQVSQTLGLAVAGALGMDAFEHVDLELDFINRKVGLFSQQHCPGQVVYWASDYGAVPIQRGVLGNIYFPMTLDGKKIETSFSTSSDITSLTTDVSKKLYGFDEHSPDVQTDFDARGKPQAQFRAMALTAGDLKIINARVRLLPKPSDDCQIVFSQDKVHAAGYDCMGPTPLHLGMSVLQNLHMYLATKEKILYLTGKDGMSSESQIPAPPSDEK